MHKTDHNKNHDPANLAGTSDTTTAPKGNTSWFGVLARIAAVTLAIGSSVVSEGCDCNGTGPTTGPGGIECNDCSQYAFDCGAGVAVCAPDGPSAELKGCTNWTASKDCSGSWGDTGGDDGTGGFDETAGADDSSIDCEDWEPDLHVDYNATSRMYEVDAIFVRELKSDPMPLTDCDDARMRMVSGGYYEFYNIDPADLAAQLGFQDGDVLLEVNGHDLLVPDDYLDALDDLMDETSFEARIDRNGTLVMLRYEVL